jgi:hypothetical protein
MFNTLAWLFVAAVALHNLEEAAFLPAWSARAGRWYRPVGAREFRFAVVVLTVLAVVAALLATLQGREGVGAYILSGYALAMLLNVAVPHVLATIVMRRYMPGTATAVALNLPVTVALLRVALRDGYISATGFAQTAPVIVLALVASIPLLFHAGRRLLPNEPLGRAPD